MEYIRLNGLSDMQAQHMSLKFFKEMTGAKSGRHKENKCKMGTQWSEKHQFIQSKGAVERELN